MIAINKQIVLWSLEELANRSEQERLWLSNGSSGEVSSFTEAICGVFDSGGVSKAMNSNGLTSELATKFKKLSNWIDKVPQDVKPQEQISHPAMVEIARLSKELIDLIEETE